MFNQLQSFEDREFTVTASFLEIYNEKVIIHLGAFFTLIYDSN